MAFTIANWTCNSTSLNQGQETVAGVVLNAPNIFTYASPTDTVATITGSNYFLTMYNSLSVGDFIIGSGTDASFIVKVVSNSVSGVTVANVINASSGGVTSVAAGTGLTGGTITSTGTIGLNIPLIQNQTYVFEVDHGIANAYTATAIPSVLAYTPGLLVKLLVGNANTGPSTLDVSGLGPIAITTTSLAALTEGQMGQGMIANLEFDGTQFQLLNPIPAGATSGVTSTQVQQAAFTSAIDTGTADNYLGALSPAVNAYTDQMILSIIPANTNATIGPQINFGAGDQGIILGGGVNVAVGDIVANYPAVFSYSSTLGAFILLNPAVSFSIWKGGSAGNSAFGGGATDGASSNTLAWGNVASAAGPASFAFGSQASSQGAFSYAFGNLAVTSPPATNSFAFGNNVTTNNAGSFVFGDGVGSGKTDTSENQYVAAFAGGYYLYGNGSHDLAWFIDTQNNEIHRAGQADQSYNLQTPSDGFTATVSINSDLLILNPAGPLTSGTVELPSPAIDGQLVCITTSQDIATLTVNAGSGDTLANPYSEALNAGPGINFIYNQSGLLWFQK